MITPTHVVINVALAHRGSDKPARDPVQRRLFILGGLAPDLGLYLMTGLAAAYYPLTQGLSLEETFRLVFDDLFYTSPGFIVAHNLLHAPLVIAALIGAGEWAKRSSRLPRTGRALQAFGLGCAVHTALDIPVHHNDGPLLLFPFDWSLRFNSPVSYYDPDHYGSIVAPVDLTITVVGLAAIGWVALRRRRSRRRGAPAPSLTPGRPSRFGQRAAQRAAVTPRPRAPTPGRSQRG